MRGWYPEILPRDYPTPQEQAEREERRRKAIERLHNHPRHVAFREDCSACRLEKEGK